MGEIDDGLILVLFTLASSEGWRVRYKMALDLDFLHAVQIHPELMPDALHPNADGMELFAKCLSPVVDKLMEEEQSGPGALNGSHFWGR